MTCILCKGLWSDTTRRDDVFFVPWKMAKIWCLFQQTQLSHTHWTSASSPKDLELYLHKLKHLGLITQCVCKGMKAYDKVLGKAAVCEPTVLYYASVGRASEAYGSHHVHVSEWVSNTVRYLLACLHNRQAILSWNNWWILDQRLYCRVMAWFVHLDGWVILSPLMSNLPTTDCFQIW